MSPKKLRSSAFIEQDLIIGLPNKTNKFVILDNKLNADKNRWNAVVLENFDSIYRLRPI